MDIHSKPNQKFSMVKESLILFLLLTIVMASCVVGTQVSIINRTMSDKSVTVYYPANFRFPIPIKGGNNDSLQAYDISQTENSITTRDYYRYPVKVHITMLDTVAKTYSFILKPKYKLILQDTYPTVSPPFGQVFVIDLIDTVQLDKSGKFFKKYPKLGKGGRWTYEITDDNTNTQNDTLHHHIKSNRKG
jgi:hypothetical protein